ncbi:MAG: N-acetyltransferase [Deltaproteobacteria bacterium]|nr:N-acetyltransferase [Deltaproteobacteria bacterium]
MIRDARLADGVAIQKLLMEYVSTGIVLSRSLVEIYQAIREFKVAVENNQVVGICSLHIWWEDLAEVRSLVVKPGRERQGIGTDLVTATLEEARTMGLKRIFALTYKPDFFVRLGFSVVDKSELPQKVWGDCVKCPKFPQCDETAVSLLLPGSKP